LSACGEEFDFASWERETHVKYAVVINSWSCYWFPSKIDDGCWIGKYRSRTI